MRWMLEKALRDVGAASLRAARKARSLRVRMGGAARRDRSDGSGDPRPRPEDAAFLGQVSETLSRLEVPGEPGDAPPSSGPAGASTASAAPWPRRWLERVRRHEDVLLAAALIVGILLMVIHWRWSGAGPWQGWHGARSAGVQAPRPAGPEEAQSPAVRGPPAAQVGPTGDAAGLGMSR